MQITIVQTEIESAIIAHIKSQVAIRDDQEITVDLRATRGAEGYQAVIDIRPKEGGQTSSSAPDGPEPPLPTLKPQPAPMKPLGIEKAVTDSIVSNKVMQPPKDLPKSVVDKAPEPAKEQPASVEALGAEANKSPLFAPKPAVPDTSEELAKAPAPASIFGSLKKPVNA